MTDKLQIATIDDAKVALDDEIASVKSMVDYYDGKIDDEKRNRDRYEQTLWRLKSLRRRMDPPEVIDTPCVAAVQDAA